MELTPPPFQVYCGLPKAGSKLPLASSVCATQMAPLKFPFPPPLCTTCPCPITSTIILPLEPDCEPLERRHGSRSTDGFYAAERTRSEERRVGKECRSRWSPY